MKKNNKAFTLIELIVVLVILAIIALIVTPLVLKIVDKADVSAQKRSIDGYGHAIELALASYELEHGDYPDSIDKVKIEYSGSKVKCNVQIIKENGKIYLSECSVNGVKVKDKENSDGYYHYGELKVPATKSLLEKANAESITTYTEGNTHEMYTFTHDATEQTEALTDYRYIGSDPYNYVTFNDELWRIIGVFTVEDANGNKEQHIKIIRDSLIDTTFSSGFEWENNSIQIYLNGDYYNSLNIDSKNMISEVKYYLGGIASETLSGEMLYKSERGITIPSGINIINWIGKIGLMYPSDYAYIYANGVDDKCYTETNSCNAPSNGWLSTSEGYQWLMSQSSSNMARSLYVNQSGGQIGVANMNYSIYYGGAKSIRPVVYLSSDILIDAGNGTFEKPYILKK